MLDLTPDQLEMVRTLVARHAPERVFWAFGSRVRGTAQPFSDLDLALVSDQPLDAATRAELAEAFSESDLPFRVDLVDWATASPGFRALIQAEHEVIHPAPSP